MNFQGKYDNISLKEYHKLSGWSKTKLDHIHKSPAHLVEYLDNGQDPTASMIFGSAFHCAVLTPDLYKKEYCIPPKCDRRTNEGKEIYADFILENKDKTEISTEDAATIERMKNAIYAHPLASTMLTNGEAEQSFFWTDPKTGLLCKCRPDYLRYDNICVDLKTTEDATYDSFHKSAYKYRYHVQGAFFNDGIFQSVNRLCEDFVLIAIEKKPPFGIMVYVYNNSALESGRSEYQADLYTAKDWETNPDNYKLVYPESNEPIELLLPSWAI